MPEMPNPPLQGNTLQDTGSGKGFLNKTPFARELGPTVGKQELTK